MKGHGSNSRYRLKTKTVHGVRTGEHNNPHVMKAAARADGGMCDGKPASKNLARAGRLKAKRVGKNAGGGLNIFGGEYNQAAGSAGRGLSELGKLGIPQAAPAAATPPDDTLTRARDAALGIPGARKRGGAVNRRNGGPTDRQKVIGELGRADASSVADTDVVGKQSRQDGGGVSEHAVRRPPREEAERIVADGARAASGMTGRMKDEDVDTLRRLAPTGAAPTGAAGPIMGRGLARALDTVAGVEAPPPPLTGPLLDAPVPPPLLDPVRKHGGRVKRKANGGEVDQEDQKDPEKDDEEEEDERPKRAAGGKVPEAVLDRHRLEHRLMAQEDKKKD